MKQKIMLILLILLNCLISNSQELIIKENLSFPKNDYEYLWHSYCRSSNNKYILGFCLERGAPISKKNVFPVIIDNKIISYYKNKILVIDKESGEIIWTKKYKNLWSFYINDKKNIIIDNKVLNSKTGEVIFNHKSEKSFLKYYKEPIAIVEFIDEINGVEGINIISKKSWKIKGVQSPFFLKDNKLICFSFKIFFLGLMCININSGKILWKKRTFNQELIGISKNNLIFKNLIINKFRAINFNTGKCSWNIRANACKILDNGEVILANKGLIYFVDSSNGKILKKINLKNHFKKDKIFGISQYYKDYIVLCSRKGRNPYFKLINLKEDHILLEKKLFFYEFFDENPKIYKDKLYFSDFKSCLEIIKLSNINKVEKITTTDKNDFIVRFFIDNDLLILVTHKGNLHVLRIL